MVLDTAYKGFHYNYVVKAEYSSLNRKVKRNLSDWPMCLASAIRQKYTVFRSRKINGMIHSDIRVPE